MTKNRSKQTVDPDAVPAPIFVLSEQSAPGLGPWHRHRRAQLIYASEGVLTVETKTGLWVVPPQRAAWILPTVRHRVRSGQQFWLRTLYVHSADVAIPPACCVVSVDPLARELLIAASTFGASYPPNGPEQRLLTVLLDRLSLLEVAALHLPNPSDARALKIARALRADPASTATLSELARGSGITARTAARLFLKETELTFGRWRQQLRLLTALELLGSNASVTEVAFAVGYSDVSSFIAMFRQALGTTPARYFDTHGPV